MSPINSFSSKVAITMVALAAVVAPTANSFAPRSSASVSRVNSAGSVVNNNNMSPLYAEETKDDSSAVFMPPPSAEDSDGEGTKETDIDLKTVEMLGRGAAKVCIFIVKHLWQDVLLFFVHFWAIYVEHFGVCRESYYQYKYLHNSKLAILFCLIFHSTLPVFPMVQSDYAILISLCIHNFLLLYDNCITNHEINK